MMLLFCGPPGSGKTEIARRLAERLGDAKIISTANFKRKVYRRLFAETEKFAGAAKYLILDGTFHRREWRETVKEIAKRNRQQVITIYLNCSLETCLRRNEARKDRIEERAVRIVYNQMEIPDSPDIVVDTDVFGPDEAVDLISRFIAKATGS